MWSTLPAASAGAVLGGRLRSFISMVLAIVIATVPTKPAINPLPTSVAISRNTLIASPPTVPTREPGQRVHCCQEVTDGRTMIGMGPRFSSTIVTLLIVFAALGAV